MKLLVTLALLAVGCSMGLKIVPNLLSTVTGLVKQLTGCLHQALTKDLTAAARAMADFLCSDAMRKSGQLDIETLRQACLNFTNAMGHLGCVKPLSDLTTGITETVDTIKLAVFECLKDSPLVVSLVETLCPAAAVPFSLYGNLLEDKKNKS